MYSVLVLVEQQMLVGSVAQQQIAFFPQNGCCSTYAACFKSPEDKPHTVYSCSEVIAVKSLKGLLDISGSESCRLGPHCACLALWQTLSWPDSVLGAAGV